MYLLGAASCPSRTLCQPNENVTAAKRRTSAKQRGNLIMGLFYQRSDSVSTETGSGAGERACVERDVTPGANSTENWPYETLVTPQFNLAH